MKKDIKEIVRFILHFIIPAIIIILGLVAGIIISFLATYEPDTKMFCTSMIDIILVVCINIVCVVISWILSSKYIQWLRDNSIIK